MKHVLRIPNKLDVIKIWILWYVNKTHAYTFTKLCISFIKLLIMISVFGSRAVTLALMYFSKAKNKYHLYWVDNK